MTLARGGVRTVYSITPRGRDRDAPDPVRLVRRSNCVTNSQFLGGPSLEIATILMPSRTVCPIGGGAGLRWSR